MDKKGKIEKMAQELGVGSEGELIKKKVEYERGDDFDVIWEWDNPIEIFLHELNRRNLESELVEYMKERGEIFIEIKLYYENGRFFENTQNFTDEEKEIVNQYDKADPNQCYYNTQMIMNSDTLDYVEGYITTLDTARPIPHAWLSLNGKVVDITLEEPDSTVYYGVSFDWKIVCKQLSERGHASPLIEVPDIQKKLIK